MTITATAPLAPAVNPHPSSARACPDGAPDGASGGLRRSVLVRVQQAGTVVNPRRVLDALEQLGYDADALRTRYEAWRQEQHRLLARMLQSPVAR